MLSVAVGKFQGSLPQFFSFGTSRFSSHSTCQQIFNRFTLILLMIPCQKYCYECLRCAHILCSMAKMIITWTYRGNQSFVEVLVLLKPVLRILSKIEYLQREILQKFNVQGETQGIGCQNSIAQIRKLLTFVRKNLSWNLIAWIHTLRDTRNRDCLCIIRFSGLKKMVFR